ncbi:DMT family transporter [Rheinheimera salexigens]|uniref:DMT family transporter n=1 Tax=Rheinheimera salexigens TaxID=1628148 RepID=UPI001913839C|nr:DMT family transporter [Rheinheimera salexigens]
MNKHLLLPILAVLFWAGNTIVNKLAVGVIFPAEIGFYRWLFAAIVLTPFMCKPCITAWPIIKAHLGKIFILGLFGMAIFQSLAYFAAVKTSANNMGIVLSLMPMMSLCLAIMALGQRLTWGALLGAAFSFVGVLYVVSAGNISQLSSQGMNVGDSMMLVAVFAYACYSTLLKKWQIPLAAMPLLYLQVVVAVVVLFPLFYVSPKAGLTAENLPLIAYACVFASIAAPLAWMTGIKHLGPSRTSIFFNAMPVITAVIAAIVLGESLAMYHIVGGGLTLFGVLLSEQVKQPVTWPVLYKA